VLFSCAAGLKHSQMISKAPYFTECCTLTVMVIWYRCVSLHYTLKSSWLM